MAMAWITRAVNATDHNFTLLQNDPTWHPVVHGKQYAPDEALYIPRMARAGQPWIPDPRFPWITVTPPSDVVTDLSLRYCVVPWQEYGRTRLVGPSGNYVEYQVGRFVNADTDHLRGVLSNGETPLMVELGPTGGAWWSVSYDFEIYMQQDQGVRWNIQSVTKGVKGVVDDVVAAAGELLKEHADDILKFLLAA
jgi:hypothetical protein